MNEVIYISVFSRKSTNDYDLSVLLENPIVGDDKLAEAQEFFKTYYAQSDFILNGPFVDDTMQAIKVYGDRKWVIIQNVNAIKNLFRNFGSLIHVIKVDFLEISIENGKEIVELINEKCSKSLETLHLENCNDNILSGLTNDHPNVFTLRFSISTANEFNGNSDSQKLNKLFPNLKTLFIDHTTAVDWKFINGKLQNLMQLNVEFEQSIVSDGEDESQIVNFLKDNQQIEQLILTRSNLKLVEKVNKHLPKLKYLKVEQLLIDYSSHPSDVIHMKNLKHLSLRSYRVDEIPERFVFDRLEKLDLNIFPYKFTDAWTQFIANQVTKDLNEFTLDAADLSADQFVAIGKKLRHLETVSVSCRLTLTAEDIVEFTEICSSLINLELNIQMDEWERNRLNEILPIEWKIEEKMRQNDNIEMCVKR